MSQTSSITFTLPGRDVLMGWLNRFSLEKLSEGWWAAIMILCSCLTWQYMRASAHYGSGRSTAATMSSDQGQHQLDAGPQGSDVFADRTGSGWKQQGRSSVESYEPIYLGGETPDADYGSWSPGYSRQIRDDYGLNPYW